MSISLDMLVKTCDNAEAKIDTNYNTTNIFNPVTTHLSTVDGLIIKQSTSFLINISYLIESIGLLLEAPIQRQL